MRGKKGEQRIFQSPFRNRWIDDWHVVKFQATGKCRAVYFLRLENRYRDQTLALCAIVAAALGLHVILLIPEHLSQGGKMHTQVARWLEMLSCLYLTRRRRFSDSTWTQRKVSCLRMTANQILSIIICEKISPVPQSS